MAKGEYTRLPSLTPGVKSKVRHSWTVSNPYCSTSGSSGGTTYTYDATGRPSDETVSGVTTKSIVYADGSATSTTYSATSSTECSTVIDPAGNARTLCSDGAARLKAVTEDPGSSPHLNYQTSYAYDALNDLSTVTQGSQTRTFTYDSLARLTSEANPESGTTHYCYTSSGSACATPDTGTTLCSGDRSDTCRRTDARSITTTYAYSDVLNRLTAKSYNDGVTPTANFSYDQSSVSVGSWSSGTLLNYKGRMTEATTTSGSTTKSGVVYSYDPLGRVSDQWQCTPWGCAQSTPAVWDVHNDYDLAGDIKDWSMPYTTAPGSKITITNTTSLARRITAISSSWSDSIHPASLATSINYEPWGAPSQLLNGCAGSGCVSTQENYQYNSRLQPVSIDLINPPSNQVTCWAYDYYGNSPTVCPMTTIPTGANNNGNVRGVLYQDHWNTGYDHTAAYTYDNVNRLATAVATGSSTYNLTFSYDAYGNMTCVTNGQTNGPCPNWTVSSSTNRLTSTGFVYDSAGDLTSDIAYGSPARTYAWDAEGRLTQVTDNSGGGTTTSYAYNALGQEVELIASGGQLEQIFNPEGERAGYYSPYSPGNGQWLLSYVHWNGREIARYSWGTWFNFAHPNALGSGSMSNDEAGNLLQDILYYPWGQVWQDFGSAYDPHFAGIHASLQGSNFADYTMYEADHRFFAPNPGRWHSPDPSGEKAVKLVDPQTWNMYAYVQNNPTTLNDPSGLDPTILANGGFVSCAVRACAVHP